MFRLYRLEEGGGLKELGIRLSIREVGEEGGIVYTLDIDVKRWQKFFGQGLEAGVKAAVEIGGRLPVEDRFPYMLGWVDSDVAITRKEKKRVLQMPTSHLWQLAETHALFDWSYVTVSNVNLTLEGPKPRYRARTSLEKLDEAIEKSAEGGWLHMLGNKEGLEDIKHVKSWEGLKRWVAGRWGVVVDAAVSRLREVLTVEELEGLLAPKRRKDRQEAPRDMQRDGENVWEELRRRLNALGDMLNDDKIAREVVAPALLLIQAERLGVNEITLRYLAAVASGAIGGDGYVSAAWGKVVLARGKLEGAMLWGAVFAAHGIKAKVIDAGNALQVIVSGGGAVKLARLYFLYGPPLLEGDERVKSHKLAEAVELGAKEALDIHWEGLRQTKSGFAADLIISEGGIAVKYNVYLRKDDIQLQFQSTDRSRVELAARLLRLAGVTAEVKRKSDEDVWYVYAYTDVLAAGYEKLRKALAEIVREAVARGWVDERKAEGRLEKLEEGRVLKEGWPKFLVRLSSSGALEVKYQSTNPNSIVQEAQRFREMGLEEGVHFTVKMPEGNKKGYVNILKDGLAYAAWLSVHGSERQRELAAEFVSYILQRAKEEGDDVRKKAEEIVKRGKERASLELEGFEKEVEVNGRKHKVKVIGGGAELDEGRSGKKLLRIRITAEVDGVRSEYRITYSRRGADNAAVGRAYASAEAPGGKEADAERLSALVKALTGKEPRVYRIDNGKIMMECYEGHLEGFTRFAELADAIEEWLEETGR